MTDDDFTESLARMSLPKPSANRLHYAAGFAAGRRRGRVWQWTTGVAALLAVAAAVRPLPVTTVSVDRVVHAPRGMSTAPPLSAPDPNSMLRLREAVLNDARLPPVAAVRGEARRVPTIGAWMTEAPVETD